LQYVPSLFQEMDGKTMAQAMDRYVLADPCPIKCPGQHLCNGWIIRFVLCHPFRSYSASHFGSKRANYYGSICAS
jgi:hypothetical protein